MDAKFYCSLFEGDCLNGSLLGMGLTGGEFWSRISGCQNVYRGVLPGNVDFESILGVFDLDDKTLQLNTAVEYKISTQYLFVLRRANHCGCEENSMAALRVIGFDQKGYWIECQCNNVSLLYAKQIGPQTVELRWFYCPIDQQADCVGFDIFSDRGTGTLDYENLQGNVSYSGPGQYSVSLEVGKDGQHVFVIKAKSAEGIYDGGNDFVKIQIRNNVPSVNMIVSAVQV